MRRSRAVRRPRPPDVAGRLGFDIPRERDGTFEPQLIGKHERRFAGFDDKILALYVRGLTVREIQALLAEM